MDQSRLGLTHALRHVEGVQDEVGVEQVVHRPADDVAVVGVDDYTEVEPALLVWVTSATQTRSSASCVKAPVT